ncbi:MAG TPA: DUF4445 domain-containing protein [Anaerolineae bacterium]|nr:DUF4445 domain-containing protein [Anaerolineae bacterium]
MVVGFTAMHHLFLGLPVGQLGMAPYVPAESAPLDVRAREVGLRFAPKHMCTSSPTLCGGGGSGSWTLAPTPRSP